MFHLLLYMTFPDQSIMAKPLYKGTEEDCKILKSKLIPTTGLWVGNMQMVAKSEIKIIDNNTFIKEFGT